MPANEDSMPKWDVALAALVDDTYRTKAAPLDLDDFHDLARQHAIRLDDIMETLFQLVINGTWVYTGSDGKALALDQATLDGMYVKRRLSEQELSTFDGDWRPAVAISRSAR